ncbi:MAG: hypothetical protein ACREMV_11395 [Gemmatimonadales bacterium]
MSNTIRLEAPRLVAEPVIASGCCAILAEDIVQEELMAVPGVHGVTVGEERGLFTVSYDPAQTEACAIRAALLGIGSPARDAA